MIITQVHKDKLHLYEKKKQSHLLFSILFISPQWYRGEKSSNEVAL